MYRYMEKCNLRSNLVVSLLTSTAESVRSDRAKPPACPEVSGSSVVGMWSRWYKVRQGYHNKCRLILKDIDNVNQLILVLEGAAKEEKMSYVVWRKKSENTMYAAKHHRRHGWDAGAAVKIRIFEQTPVVVNIGSK